jgi:acetyl esterase/lipase
VRQTGDLYLPDGQGPHPVAVVIHGGGWSGRDRTDMEDISKRLASQGIAAYNINYRLAPEHRFPAQVDNVRAALQWLVTEADSYALDPERIYTVGYSAGAHLALLAATDPQAPTVHAVIAGGTPTDLTRYPESPYVKKLMGISIDEDPDAYRSASPLYQVTPDHPPVFLYHGRLDAIVHYRNAILLKEALEDAGVPVTLHTRPLLGHIITYAWDRPSIDRGIRFLNSLHTR